jgi:hypothetical protein
MKDTERRFGVCYQSAGGCLAAGDLCAPTRRYRWHPCSSSGSPITTAGMTSAAAIASWSRCWAGVATTRPT